MKNNNYQQEYGGCDPNYANGGVLEVKEELRQMFEHKKMEIGYFGQFTTRVEDGR